jgi:predicted Zn-dependent protease
MGIRVSRLNASVQNKKDDNTTFLRVQTLARARYSDPQTATRSFAGQMQGRNRCAALMGQGILAARQNRVNDASVNFAEALACAPNAELIIREAGRFHYTKGDRNKGAALLQQAVAMNRNDTYALFYHARSLADSGRSAEAIDFAKQVQLKVPDDAEVYELLARLYGENRQMFQANLHMAYSALYENKEPKVRQFMDKAKALAKTPRETEALERLDRLYKERKQYWK